MDKSISIETEVAHLVLYHPDDLAHRDQNPIAWYGYDFAYRHESAAGRLIAWGTGADGDYLVRLTNGALTADERARACASWSFPLVVRHGRLLLDNTDALPGEERMADPAELVDAWFDLPNGTYRTTVHPIDRTEQAAAALPDYVVKFEPAETLAGIEVAATPPELRPLKGWTPRQPASMETEQRFLWRDVPLDGGDVAALVVPQDCAILPIASTSVPVSEEVANALFPDMDDGEAPPVALTGALRPGALAVVAQVSGRSWMSGRGTRLSFAGLTIARIVETRPGAIVPSIRLASIDKPAMAADDSILARFRAQLASAGAASLTVSSFEMERMETLSTAEGLTGWALMHLAIPLDQRLSLWASPAGERIAGIERLLPG